MSNEATAAEKLARYFENERAAADAVAHYHLIMERFNLHAREVSESSKAFSKLVKHACAELKASAAVEQFRDALRLSSAQARQFKDALESITGSAEMQKAMDSLKKMFAGPDSGALTLQFASAPRFSYTPTFDFEFPEEADDAVDETAIPKRRIGFEPW